MQGTPLKLSADEHSGRALGKYEVLCRLSLGGMSEIFLAFSRGLAGFRKLVVLKQILPDIKGEEEFVRMFLDEAKITAAFNHPNIAQVYDLDTQQGELFLAMEFVPGATLVEVARACRQNKEPIPVGFTLSAVRDTALALHYAHTFTDPVGNRQTVIHRDIAEKNIMVTYEGVTKLLDFGIAKNLLWRSRTQVGMVKGTSGYMSPEQIMGEPLDARSDIFSLGVVLHECLTGMRLFHGKTPEQGMTATLKSEPPLPSSQNPQVTAALDAVTQKALAKKREDRFTTALEFARELERAAAGLSWHPEQSAVFMQRLFADRQDQTRALLATIQDDEVSGARNIVALLGEQPDFEPVRSLPNSLPPPLPPPPSEGRRSFGSLPPVLETPARARPELVHSSGTPPHASAAHPPPPPKPSDIPTNPGRRLQMAEPPVPSAEQMADADFLLDDEDGMTVADQDLEGVLQRAGLRKTDEDHTTDAGAQAYVPEPMTQLAEPRFFPEPRNTEPEMPNPIVNSSVTSNVTTRAHRSRAGRVLLAAGAAALVLALGIARFRNPSSAGRSTPSLPPASLAPEKGEPSLGPVLQQPIGPPLKQPPPTAPQVTLTPPPPAAVPTPAPTPSAAAAPAAAPQTAQATSTPAPTPPPTVAARPTPKPRVTPPPAPAPVAKGPGRLSLVTHPGSTVLLKSQRLGPTPLADVLLPPGSHTLRLLGDDGAFRILKVEIKAGEQTALDVPLSSLETE